MDQTLVFDKEITAQDDPIFIVNLTSPTILVGLTVSLTSPSFDRGATFAIEQILPNQGNPFIADRQVVEFRGEPVLIRLRANYPYSLRVDLPGWISSGFLKVWEVENFNFFMGGGSSGPPPDLSAYVLGTDPRLSNARAPLPHTQGIDTITGLTSALASKLEDSALTGYVQTNDSRLSDARSPLNHLHTIANVTGLETRLSALESGSPTKYFLFADSGSNGATSNPSAWDFYDVKFFVPKNEVNGNFFNSSTGVFTAGKSGNFGFNVHLNISSSGFNYINVAGGNGSNYNRTSSRISQGSIEMTGMIPMSSGQTFKVKIATSSGGMSYGGFSEYNTLTVWEA